MKKIKVGKERRKGQMLVGRLRQRSEDPGDGERESTRRRLTQRQLTICSTRKYSLNSIYRLYTGAIAQVTVTVTTGEVLKVTISYTLLYHVDEKGTLSHSINLKVKDEIRSPCWMSTTTHGCITNLPFRFCGSP